MTESLADRVGAASYAATVATQPDIVSHLAVSMAAFRAAALVDLAGPRTGDDFERLYAAVEAKAPGGGTFAERFHSAVRTVTAEALGVDCAGDWWALDPGAEASRLYRPFLAKLPSRHPELIREVRSGV